MKVFLSGIVQSYNKLHDQQFILGVFARSVRWLGINGRTVESILTKKSVPWVRYPLMINVYAYQDKSAGFIITHYIADNPDNPEKRVGP